MMDQGLDLDAALLDLRKCYVSTKRVVIFFFNCPVYLLENKGDLLLLLSILPGSMLEVALISPSH